MILQYPSDCVRSKNECLAAIGFFRGSSFGTNSNKRQKIVAFRKSNSGCLAKLWIFKCWKFDDEQFARNRGELVDRADRFVQMMNYIEQTNVVELLIEWLSQNVALKKFNPTSDDIFEQTSLAESFSIQLDADDTSRSSCLGLETKIAKRRTHIQNALAS